MGKHATVFTSDKSKEHKITFHHINQCVDQNYINVTTIYQLIWVTIRKQSCLVVEDAKIQF